MTSPNSIEKTLFPILQNQFPNYVAFREKFLIPLRGLPSDPNWRIDTHPLLEQVGVTSYGILKSIYFIHYRKNKLAISDPDQSFKNIYFHFGLIFDCVEVLSKVITHLEQELEITNVNTKLRLSREKLVKDYEEWVDEKYDTRFQEMVTKGKPIIYYPQHDHTYLSLIIKNPTKRKYNKYVKIIKDYRNFFIHNPGVDIFQEISSEWLFTLKKESVEESKNWSNMQFMFIVNKDHFVNPFQMIKDDSEELLQLLNKVWIYFDKNLSVIFEHDGFEKLFKNYNRDIKF